MVVNWIGYRLLAGRLESRALWVRSPIGAFLAAAAAAVRAWTPTLLRAADFESAASTNSATPAISSIFLDLP